MRIYKIEDDSKKWIGVDLDCSLAEYDHYRGPEHIGIPIPKMVNRVKRWLADGKTVKIFTARASGKDKEKAIKAIKKWCKENIGKVLEVTCEKDHHMESLWDDRAVRVRKNEGTRIASMDWGNMLSKEEKRKNPEKFEASRKALGADAVNNFLANFGMGPKYVPKATTKKDCPKCGGKNAYVKESHPDTDMNEMGLYCPDCKYSEE